MTRRFAGRARAAFFKTALLVGPASFVGWVGAAQPAPQEGRVALAFADTPEKSKERPQILSVTPWAVAPGRKVTLTVRGSRLDKATWVHMAPSPLKAELVKHGRAAVPNGLDAKRVGDTEAVVELDVPARPPRPPFALVIETPEGETEPFALEIEATPTPTESEPNGGFREAQALTPGGAVDGRIERPQDVDVYRVEGRAGDRLVLDLTAARRGSALDPLLSVYDARGRLLSDEAKGAAGLDARLEVVLPEVGSYLAVVMDAQDRGGPLFFYRLAARVEPGPGSPAP